MPPAKATVSTDDLTSSHQLLRKVREDNANTRRFLRRVERRLDEQSGANASLSVDDFCRLEGIHRDTFYELLKQGRGPIVMRVGDPVKGQIRITAQARWEWQRAREAEATAATIPP
jgi:hypothetical protein